MTPDAGARPSPRPGSTRARLDPSVDLVPAVTRAARSARTAIAAPLAELGLHPGQDLLLVALATHGDVRQSEIAARLGVEPPTLARMLTRMEGSGLVERYAHDHDRRVWLVRLGEEGRALVPKIQEIWLATEERASHGLTDKEAGTLRRLLGVVEGNLSDRSTDVC